MIVDLTAAWSGPYTAAAGNILQPLGGAVMVSMGAGAPGGGVAPVIVGRLALAAGQVFWARATDASVTARFYMGAPQ
jgi:hypothetical protein